MNWFQGKFRDRRPGILAIVVVCLVLVFFLSIAQVTHLHQNASEADHCALCLAMHSAAPILLAAAAAMVLVQLELSAPVFKVRPVVRYWHPQLFTRPPPQGF